MRSACVMTVMMVVMSVAGCSSLPPGNPAKVSGSHQTDVEKVALINAVARVRGVEVIWINPPQKRTAAAVKPDRLPQ